MEKEQKVGSIRTYLEKLEKYENKNLIFRGESKCSWELKPSIFRKEYRGKEKEFYNRMKSYNPIEMSNQKGIVEEMALFQHYGIPTRLLDWSFNSMVALFFAVNEDLKDDGKVYILKDSNVFYHEDKEVVDYSEKCFSDNVTEKMEDFIKNI